MGRAGALATEALTWTLAKSGNRVVGVYPNVHELGSALGAGHQMLQAVIVDADEQAGRLMAVADIRHAYPELKILVLCDAVSAAVIHCAINEQADGVVLKSESIEEVVLALRHVLAGRAVMPAGWQAASLEPEPNVPLAALSAREREVLELVTEGMSNEEVAKRLVISSNTVKFHLRTIYSRLGVNNRVQAARVVSLGQETPPDLPNSSDNG
ncbi:MAG: response regulator transcription factor [Solirubrobacteraceae bacterium]